MFYILRFIRAYIGGKTELGLLFSILALAIYMLPIVPQFTFDMLVPVLTIIGTFTGTALFSRIEDKKGTLDAFKSLFAAFRKKR